MTILWNDSKINFCHGFGDRGGDHVLDRDRLLARVEEQKLHRFRLAIRWQQPEVDQLLQSMILKVFSSSETLRQSKPEFLSLAGHSFPKWRTLCFTREYLVKGKDRCDWPRTNYFRSATFKFKILRIYFTNMLPQWGGLWYWAFPLSQCFLVSPNSKVRGKGQAPLLYNIMDS